VGEGQSINITGKNVTIKGYLTVEDRNYIAAACQIGLKHFMLSFVEQDRDINEVERCIEESLNFKDENQPKFVLKIESQKGLEYIRKRSNSKHQLMAARDDLMVQIGQSKVRILPALEEIVHTDPEAICASRLFSSLEHDGDLSLGDLADLFLMEKFGYKHFLLSDGLCRHSFASAMKVWQEYREVFKVSYA
jgi:pyruvate kinase